MRDLCVTPRLSLLMRQARLNGRVLCRWGEIHGGFEGLLVVDQAVRPAARARFQAISVTKVAVVFRASPMKRMRARP